MGGSNVWVRGRGDSQPLPAGGAARDLNGFGAGLDTSASNPSRVSSCMYTQLFYARSLHIFSRIGCCKQYHPSHIKV